jgi:putative transcriptional regulator
MVIPEGGRSEVLGAGRLLVANPLLPDPNFDRTVVLLLAYGEEGAFGVILNRPSDTQLATPLPGWEHLAASPAVVFMGGPVQQHQTVICLARALGHPAASVPPSGWSAVLPDVGTLDLDLDPQGLHAAFSQVRVFAGYAGWNSGQLEAELGAGAWWTLDAQADDPFSDEPGDLWKRVLRRQGGSLSLVAAYPDDPMFN